MNIGMMTTWGQHCGIAGYTEQLIDVLMGNGHWVTVFGNKPYGKRVDRYKADIECFGTGFQPDTEWKIDLDKIKSLVSLVSERFPLAAFEVFHIQYQDYLYPDKQGLDKLLLYLKDKKIKLVVTQHDSCISPNVDWGKFDIIIRHGPEFKRNGKEVVIPIGIPEIEYKPLPRNKVLSSFGMGRNDNEVCQKVCDKEGWTFRFHNSQDKWVKIKELMVWLQEGDAIALIYPPVGAEVSSSALRIALGTGRPVIVSDTNWFNDLEEHPTLMKKTSWDYRPDNLEFFLVFWGIIFNHKLDLMLWENKNKAYYTKNREKLGWNKIVKYYEGIYGNLKS